MQYYKVNPNYDGYLFHIRFKWNSLIKNELYTKKEVEKSNIPADIIYRVFTIIEITPKNTYWFFGARFKKSNP